MSRLLSGSYFLSIEGSFEVFTTKMATNVLIKQDETGPQGDVDLYAGVDDFGSAANTNEGPEAAYSADLYEDVINQQGIPGANGQQIIGEGPPGGKEYKSYTTLHPKSALQQEKEAKIAASLYSKSNDKGKALYVGNLTWWTTDEELASAIEGCGVTDLINIKFFENRANGQSKGFAVVEVESETSQRLIMERLDKQELHGQKPVVTHVSKQNLIMFENQSKKNTPGGEQQDPVNQGNFQPRNAFVNNARFPVRFPPRMPVGVRPGMPGDMQQPFVGMPNSLPRMPQFAMAPMDPNMIRPPGVAFPGMVPGMVQNVGAPGMPHVQEPMMAGVPVSMQLPGGQTIHGSVADRPELNALQHAQKPGIAPHVNPAFLAQEDHLVGGAGMRVSLPGHGIGEVDIESLRRNQSVASAAIQRAMGDANEGDYESGIETLVTAISIIKQSSTANAESSQVLVQSLQDCLHTLEAQLISKGKSDRDRDDINRSPLDDYRGDRRSRRRHRSRSRSRSRDKRRSYSPRGRSRSRDRRRR